MTGGNLASLKGVPFDWVAVDFETANRHRGSVCSVGLALVSEGTVVASASELVDPRADFDGYNMGVHHIGPRSVVGAPTFAELWPSLAPLLDRSVVAAHNASFDISCLRAALHNAELHVPAFEYLCSHRMAKRVWPAEPSYALDWLTSRFDIPLEHHDARSDAVGCAELVLLACRTTGAAGPTALVESFGSRLSPMGSFLDARRLPDQASTSADHRFHGKTLCSTGSLDSMLREEAAQLVTAVGGSFVDNMSRKVDFLIVSDHRHADWLAGEPTGKIKKLLQLRELQTSNAEVLNERDFLAILFGG